MKLLDPLAQFFDFLLPSSCLSCQLVLSGDPQRFLCPDCHEKIKFLEESFCTLCGDPFSNSFLESHLCKDCLKDPPSFEQARSMFKFEETVSKIIYSFKYHGSEAIFPWFRAIFSDWTEQNGIKEQLDWIVPVPLHPFRLIRRGYNQSLLLAKEIGKILKVPIEYQNLIRKNYEKPQSSKSREDRKKEIRKAFDLKNKKLFKDKNLLLIDDVYTTGATVEECAKVLKKGGAKVHVFTLARTPLKQ